LVNKAG